MNCARNMDIQDGAKCCKGQKEHNSNIGLLFESLVYK